MSLSIEYGGESKEFNPSLPKFELTGAQLLPKPWDVPEDHIAYNPSGIWTIPEDQPGAGLDVMYVRVEPNRSSPGTSHLGKAYAKPYIIDLDQESPEPVPFYGAMTIRGEDPSLTRINRLSARGKVEKVWLLGVVDAQPVKDRPDQVGSLQTRFYAGLTLETLEHVADGPEWMKDIRIVQAGNPETSTAVHVYGRPQPGRFTGNANYIGLDDISHLTPDIIAEAPFIDDDLWRVGSGVWGGVNDIFSLNETTNILATHRAWNVDEAKTIRHYEAVLYAHDFVSGRIKELGTIATANQFPEGTVKDDEAVDLHDVVFTGGGFNGQLELLTFGARDGMIGLGKVVQVAHSRRPQLSLVAGE